MEHSTRQSTWQFAEAMEVLRALLLSIAAVALFVVVECAVIFYAESNSYDAKYGVQIIDFQANPQLGTGVFLCCETFSGAEGNPRYRVGSLDAGNGCAFAGELPFSQRVRCIALGKLGTAFTGFADGSIVEVETPIVPGAIIDRSNIAGEVHSIHPYKDHWIIVSDAESVFAYDLRSREKVWRQAFGFDRITTVELHDDTLFCGDCDGRVAFLDARTGESRASWQLPRAGIARLAYERRNNLLAAMHHNGILVVWDLTSGRNLWSLQSTPIFAPRFSPDGKHLVAARSPLKSEMAMFGARDGDILSSFEPHGAALGARFSSDGETIYSWGRDGVIRAWETDSSRKIWQTSLASKSHIPNFVRPWTDSRSAAATLKSNLMFAMTRIAGCRVAPSTPSIDAL